MAVTEALVTDQISPVTERYCDKGQILRGGVIVAILSCVNLENIGAVMI